MCQTSLLEHLAFWHATVYLKGQYPFKVGSIITIPLLE